MRTGAALRGACAVAALAWLVPPLAAPAAAEGPALGAVWSFARSYGVRGAPLHLALAADGKLAVAFNIGVGLRVSEDGGLTWRTDASFTDVAGIHVAPDKSLVQVATPDRVAVSTDGAKSWTFRRFRPAAEAGDPVIALAASTDGKRAFVVTADRAAVYATADAWQTAQAAKLPTEFPLEEAGERLGLAASADLSVAVLWPREGGVLLSRDGGRTWTRHLAQKPIKSVAVDARGSVAAAIEENQKTAVAHIWRGESGDWAEIAAPVRARAAYVAPEGGAIFVGGQSATLEGLIRASDDRGATWRSVPLALERNERAAPQEYWIERFRASPSGRLLYAFGMWKRGEGNWYSLVLRSGDGGATWAVKPEDASANDPDRIFAAADRPPFALRATSNSLMRADAPHWGWSTLEGAGPDQEPLLALHLSGNAGTLLVFRGDGLYVSRTAR